MHKGQTDTGQRMVANQQLKGVAEAPQPHWPAAELSETTSTDQNHALCGSGSLIHDFAKVSGRLFFRRYLP